MNRLDTSSISDPNVAQPFTGPSALFLQLAMYEGFDASVRNMAGSSWSVATPYALYGVLRASAISGTISEGFISFGKEIFYFTGIGNYNTFVNSGVFVISETDAAGPYNPITFTDGTPRNPNKIRRVTLLDQVNGTGDFNYDAVIYLNKRIATLSPADYFTTTGSKEAITGGLFTTPHSGTRKYRIMFSGSVVFVSSGAGVNGAELTIEQVTGSVVLGIQQIYSNSAIGTSGSAFNCVGIITALPPSQTIQVYVKRLGSNNVDVNGIYVTFEEYL